MLEMNGALILGALRQHELTEEAERLNAQLRDEMAQRRQAEGALRQSEARFRSLFASAPMALFACDREGVIQQYNARAVELWGHAPKRGVEGDCGSSRLCLPDGQPLPHEQSPVVEVLRTRVPTLNREVALKQPDGTRVPVLVNSAPLTDDQGEIIGAITSFIDLTERKRLEQHSLRSQRLESIGTLAGGIAHDLNNSLGPVLLALDLLREDALPPASLELIDLAESSAQRGAEMVRRIVAFARGAEGEQEEVQIPPLIGEIEKIVANTFLRHIQIRTHVAPDVSPVVGDSTQLYQVLLNLCLNARDAMPEGGLLEISAENRHLDSATTRLSQNPAAKAGPYVLLEVRDSGTGMAAVIVEKIFDPFFTTKKFGNGCGLGLSTALAIVQGHGGFFDVTSAEGKGTTFQIFLPAQLQTTPPAIPAGAPKAQHGGGALILVVDDELLMRRATQHILEKLGYRVLLACDGAEAVAIYTERRAEIAAVITDMTMPVMDGPALVRILRNMNPLLPILGVSGLAAMTYAPQLAKLGVHHVLAKPYTAAELTRTLQQMLAPKKAGAAAESNPVASP